MSTCPACGVAVVSGYVKCPRCGARQPSVTFRKPGVTADPGGTAVEGRPAVPWIPIAIGAVVAIAIIALFATRHGHKDEPPPPAPPPVAAAPRPAQSGPTLDPGFAPLSATTAPSAPTAGELAAELQRTLEAQRLWSTVSVTGATLEIRSSTCGDPQMKPNVERIVAAAAAAGLTHLRCVEQSGAVAFTREL